MIRATEKERYLKTSRRFILASRACPAARRRLASARSGSRSRLVMVTTNRIFRASGALAVLLALGGCGGGDRITAERAHLADVAVENGMYDLALQLADDMIQKDPSNIRALEVRADTLAALGKRDQAITAWQAVLTRDPGSVRANAGMGKAVLRDNPAAAAGYFERGLKTDPKDVVLLNDLGIALDLQDRHAEAQVAYRRALAVRPDDTPSTVDLALSLAMSGQGAEAMALIDPVAARPDATPEVRHNRAIILAWAGHRAEAEKILSADLPPEAVARTLAQVPAGGAAARVVRPAAAPGQSDKLSTSAPVPLQSESSNRRGGS